VSCQVDVVQQTQPIAIGKIQIDQDQVEVFISREPTRFLQRGRGKRYAVRQPGQVGRGMLKLRVVINDENVSERLLPVHVCLKRDFRCSVRSIASKHRTQCELIAHLAEARRRAGKIYRCSMPIARPEAAMFGWHADCSSPLRRAIR